MPQSVAGLASILRLPGAYRSHEACLTSPLRAHREDYTVCIRIMLRILLDNRTLTSRYRNKKVLNVLTSKLESQTETPFACDTSDLGSCMSEFWEIACRWGLELDDWCYRACR